MLPSTLSRWAAIIGMLGVAVAHLNMLPFSFHVVAYIGVTEILATGMALVAAIALLVSDTRVVWAFALLEGALNTAGYLVTRLMGLPLAARWSTSHWSQRPALALALLGAMVAVVAAWTLHDRRRLPRVSTPVTSAQQRELLLLAERRGRQARRTCSPPRRVKLP